MTALSPAFILVEPEHPRNVGAVARALANLGFDDLRIVAAKTRDYAGNNEARMSAHGAVELLARLRSFESLAAACADLRLVAGTSARSREARRSQRLDLPFARRLAHEDGLGLVFGSERMGLDNESLARCHHVLELPTWGEQPSYNLAQAVLVAGLTLRAATTPRRHRPKRVRPVQVQLDETLVRLEQALDGVGFFRPELAARTRDHLRRIVMRGVESTQELGVLDRLAHRLRLVKEGVIPPAEDEPGAEDEPSR